jgi:hypothetical protein
MTQLTIKPGSFFICGPVNGDLLEADKKFHKSEEILNSYGLNTVNQFMLYNSKGLTIENLKYTVMHMAGCNTIVTLNHWAACEFAKRQVEIARLMGLDVIDYNKLVLHLTEKHA